MRWIVYPDMERVRGVVDIRRPKTEQEFAAYYDLRWRVLRKPWGQPKGSEKDDKEEESIHIMAVDKETGGIVGVGRLHKNSDEEGQIRFMAVRDDYRGRGIGRMILSELHAEATRLGLKRVVLVARDPAVGFYAKHGYNMVGKSDALFGSITHQRMEITLIDDTANGQA